MYDHMAQSKSQVLPAQQDQSKKRKDAPAPLQDHAEKRPKTHHRPDHQAKRRDARTLAVQTTSKAFRNGELDVDKFVKAREYEIQALEDGMQRSKKALNRRAFQQVPRDLRRRTASHNVKKIPKRLRERAKKEIIEDNTPTGGARRKKPTSHMRLRIETARRLRALGAKQKVEKEVGNRDNLRAAHTKVACSRSAEGQENGPAVRSTTIKTRQPKVKKALLASPPTPKAKFRKRQIHKAWLPTHLFHAKRAHMTPPSAPLWRFSLALSPTAKSYRPTHRASRARGAVTWDTSYLSTIGLEGRHDSLTGILRALGAPAEYLDGTKSTKWLQGRRALDFAISEREAPHHLIAPVTVVWCLAATHLDMQRKDLEHQKRRLIIRVHPAAFFQLWEELLRLAKVAKPQVSVQDLRFEIGSITITGPGATEALLGSLWPTKTIDPSTQDRTCDAMNVDQRAQARDFRQMWTSLAGLTSPSLLPQNALLSFDVQDPRLHHPPRTILLPKTDVEQNALLDFVVHWPFDDAQAEARLFDRKARTSAGSALSSQKAINRRKSLTPPGQYPESLPIDPCIPILVYTSTLQPLEVARNMRISASTSSWTLLAPWKCIQPIWYSIMYYPLSTGQQPRFGGLDEMRQLLFEAGQPWYPADFPGTKAGWEWEMQERKKRQEEWTRRPKGKRVSWEKIDLGDGKKGEIGNGWACDWEFILQGSPRHESSETNAATKMGDMATGQSLSTAQKDDKTRAFDDRTKTVSSKPAQLCQLSAAQALVLLKSPAAAISSSLKSDSALVTVRLTLLTRGVPQICARIYRLPSATNQTKLRGQWVALLSTEGSRRSNKSKTDKQPGPKHALPRLPKDAPPHIFRQRLAQSLLELPKAGEDAYPACPGEADLVGFVTTGNFNLGEGQGTGIGSLLLSKVMEGAKRNWVDEGRFVIVRNAGTSVGRLARWDLV